MAERVEAILNAVHAHAKDQEAKYAWVEDLQPYTNPSLNELPLSLLGRSYLHTENPNEKIVVDSFKNYLENHSPRLSGENIVEVRNTLSSLANPIIGGKAALETGNSLTVGETKQLSVPELITLGLNHGQARIIRKLFPRNTHTSLHG